MGLQELLAELGEEKAAVVNAAIEAERTKGITESRRKGEEVKKHITQVARYKDALRDTFGIDEIPDDADLKEILAERAKPAKKADSDEKWKREIDKLRKQFEDKERSEQALRQQLNGKKIADRLSSIMKDTFHGSDLIIKDFISSGRVKLTDDENVVWIDGESEIEVEKGVEAFRKSRPDLVKNVQKAGGGSYPTKTENRNQNVMTNSAFNAMHGKDRAKFIADGGKVID